MSARPRERGAAAVEMAIVLPLLLLVIGGIVDFGRLFYTQMVIGNAAREGVRVVAMGSPTTPGSRVNQAVGASLPGLTVNTTIAQGCPNANGAKVTVTVPTGSGQGQFHWTVLNVIPSFFGGNVPVPAITATGNMRCQG